MRFSTSAIALAAVGFTSALPASTPSACNTVVPSSTSTSTGCTSTSPTPQPSKPACPLVPDCKPCNVTPPAPSNPNIVKPTVTSQYEVWTGAVRYGTTGGKIFKDGRSTDITTLLTFNVPAESAGKTCTFHLDLSADPSAKVSGTGQFDVFTSLAPAAGNSSSWPSGNLRDQHLGRMTAQRSGAATWVAGFPALGQGFPCPAGKTYGAELVGAGDAEFIEWLAGTSGAFIRWF